MAQTIKVSICGNEYPLRSNDELLTRQLAEDLDTSMREMQQKLPGQSATTIAVLTALNYAEQEVHTEQSTRRELDRLSQTIEAMTEMLVQTIEEN